MIVEEDFILTATVLLETEWVLRSRYRFTRSARARALRMILDLPGLVEAPSNAPWAIARMEAGADFADMLHMATASGATRFATFDKRVSRKASSDTPLPIELLA